MRGHTPRYSRARSRYVGSCFGNSPDAEEHVHRHCRQGKRPVPERGRGGTIEEEEGGREAKGRVNYGYTLFDSYDSL